MRKKIQFGAPPKQKETGQILTLTIERLSDDGRGVAKAKGKTLFVDGALPRETVSAKVVRSHKSYDESELVDILQPSSDRVSPPCQHFSQCGGCSLQHLSTEAQRSAKTENVLSLLKKVADIQPSELFPALFSSDSAYRRTARIGINQRQRDGSIIIGFRRKNSNHLVQIDHCHILPDQFNQFLTALPPIIASFKKPKTVTHLELIAGDNNSAATFRITSDISQQEQQSLRQLGQSLNIEIFFDQGRKPTLDPTDLPLNYQLKSFDCTLWFKPKNFIQVNGNVNQLMVQQAMEWLRPNQGEQILDLFCGIGNFSLPLASFGAEVTGVEGSEEMVQIASQNARQLKEARCNFYSADLSGDLSDQPWMKQHFDKVLLDPPRDGAYAAIEQLAEIKASQILYISCQPSSLARDAKLLSSQGYQLTKLGIMDMFPHSHHVETMALFERRP